MKRWVLAAVLLVAVSGTARAAAESEAAIDIQSALDAAHRGHFDDGIRLMTMAIDSNQLGLADKQQAYKYRAFMYQRQKKTKEAVRDYTMAITLKPNDASAYDMRGTAYQAGGEVDRAIADYDKALKLQPDNSAAHVNRGFAYITKKQFKRAVNDFDVALRLSPKSYAAYRDRALAYSFLGEYKKSAADYATAIGMSPKDPNVLYEAGRVRFLLGDFGSAAHDLAQSLSLYPNQPYTVIWSYIAAARDGKRDVQQLAANAAKVKGNAWPRPVISMFEGKTSVGAVKGAAIVGNARSRQGKACEAPLYIGEYQLLTSDRGAARQSFQQALDSCPPGLYEHAAASEELKRLKG